MQIYPVEPAFTAGQAFELGVQPNKRFCLALYQQQGDETLSSFSGVRVEALHGVTCRLAGGKTVFEAPAATTATSFDRDWCWPTITLRPHAADVRSGIYVAVAYEVDADGKPTDALGRRCAAHQPLPSWPPYSDSMALLVGRPATPSARIAYIVPIATYHAYNSTGGGSFYDDNVHRTFARPKVTLRRPGGGLGARLGEPTDPYDRRSPRQTFTHWDAKFIRWLRAQQLDCDFYTDVDLHTGATLNLTHYRCMLSVGHHEYWSQSMREHVARFVSGGGNLAVFSGNTCYRPIDFGVARVPQEINRLADHWPDNDETELIGLSYGFGGGRWGDWRRLIGWIRTKREAIGYTVQRADHWVFAGTGLVNGDVFGAEDRLVGYEADGVRPGHTAFDVLASTPPLVGWDIGGTAALGLLGAHASESPCRGLVFNCGTTDWARVLMDPNAVSHTVVRQITGNVVRAFAGLDASYVSFSDATAPSIAEPRPLASALID